MPITCDDAAIGVKEATARRDARRAMFAAWLTKCQERTRIEREKANAANALWWERKKLATAERRREKDRLAKRLKRNGSTMATRTYTTDRKLMTPEERVAHDREKGRLQRAEHRRKAKLKDKLNKNSNFGRF